MTSTDFPATAPLNMSMAEIQYAYSALEHKFKSLQDQKRPGNGRGKNMKKARGNYEPQELISKEACKFYCHAHGYQNSHNSGQCKVMANQPQNFNAEMRKARDPIHPAGGSTTVRGRRSEESGSASALTVHATGLMVTDHDDDSALPSPEAGDDATIATHPPPTERNLPPLRPRAT